MSCTYEHYAEKTPTSDLHEESNIIIIIFLRIPNSAN